MLIRTGSGRWLQRSTRHCIHSWTCRTRNRRSQKSMGIRPRISSSVRSTARAWGGGTGVCFADWNILATIEITEPVDCDRTRVAQLLSNLLRNAVTHGSETEPIEGYAAKDADSLTISVTNRGEPIIESAMQRLFQPFFRGDLKARQTGLGLGLHIASEIAKAHCGELTVISTAALTQFPFTIP